MPVSIARPLPLPTRALPGSARPHPLAARVPRIFVPVLPILALLLVLPAPLAGQSLRDGLWVGGGVGGSSTRITCQVCTAERATGLAAYVQVGGTVSPRTRVGLEGTGWLKDDLGLNQKVGSLSLATYFHPRQRGLFFKAGPSVLIYRATDDDDNEARSRSFGAIVGLGYELPTGGSWVLTPAITVHASSFGRMENEEGDVISRDVNLSLIQLSIGVTTR